MAEDPLISPVEVVEAAIEADTEVVPDGYTANALVHKPASPPETDVCERLISVFEPVNVLGVAIQHDPSYYIRLCRDHQDLDPSRLAVVDVTPADNGPSYDDVTVKTVPDPQDLTGLGISVTQLVKQAARSDRPTVVCFDSLTPLLQYVDMDRCYRFLDMTTNRLSQVCAVSHAHVNPRAHDTQEIEQLSSAFDTVITSSGDGWSVRPS